MHLEDEPLVVETVERALTAAGTPCKSTCVGGIADYLAAIERKEVGLVLIDYLLPESDGLSALEMGRRKRPDVPYIFFTGALGEEKAVEVLKAGASDFILKPNLARLLTAIRRALNEAAERKARIQAERALIDREAYYRFLIENALDLVAVISPEGKILFQSASSEALLGYRPVEMMGRSMFDWLHPDDHAKVREVLARMPELRSEPDQMECRFRHKDGSWRVIEGRGRAFVQADGQLVCVVNARDVTVRKRMEQELRDAEALYRALVEQSLAGVYMIRDDKVVYINQAGAAVFGYTPEEIINRLSPLELAHPDDRPLMNENVRARMEGRVDYVRYVFRGLRKDGAMVYCRVFGRRIPYQGGQAIIGTLVDITDHRHVQDELIKVSSVVEQAADTVLISDRAGRIEYVNPAFEKLTGYSRDEVIGKTPRLLKSGVHDAEFYRELWTTILGGQTFQKEFVNRKKSGEFYYQEGAIRPIVDKHGAITHFVSTGRDITGRKQAEARIREQADLLDKAQDAISVRDLENRIIFWNSGAERLYGYSKTEACGQSALTLLRPEPPGRLEEIRKAVLETGEWKGELKHRTKAGAEIIVASRWTLVCDDHGQPKAFLVINTDVTENKRLTEQFLHAQRMESLGTLAGGIAHDLNNVLAPIMMAVQVLRMNNADAESSHLLETLEASVRRGSEIVKQVLTFARGLKGEMIVLQPKHLVKEMARIIRETFPKELQLKVHTPQDLWTVVGDATQLHQVLMNLCVNARDAMPQGGVLEIAAENVTLDENYAGMQPGAKPGPYVRLKVRDTGSGIPQGIQDKIFEPFFTTKERGKGTGLGLSTVLGIVRSHQGFVTLQSKPGEGTTFLVYLPADVSGEVTPAAEREPDLPRGQGELIMIVDDEQSVCEVTRNTLEKFGYRTIVASDGAEAIAAYVQHQADVRLVITDVAMPMMSGAALVRALRRLNPGVRIIFSSGLGSAGDLGVASDLGVRHTLLKPHTAETLLTTLRDALSERA
ncbi:MAG: PAS domain S-box protein [Verrucomicrobiota bacterium]